MVLAHLSGIEQYSALHPRFAQAMEFLLTNNLAELLPGEIIISDQIRAIVIEDELVTEAASLEGFECHNANIDIQVCVSGKERVGWRSRHTCSEPKGEYNEAKDVLFYNDMPDHYFELSEGHFGIYFPNDVHAPMIGGGRIKKVVVKVAV